MIASPHLQTLLKNLHLTSTGKPTQITIIGGSDLFHGAPILALKTASRIVDMVFFTSPDPIWAKLPPNLNPNSTPLSGSPGMTRKSLHILINLKPYLWPWFQTFPQGSFHSPIRYRSPNHSNYYPSRAHRLSPPAMGH